MPVPSENDWNLRRRAGIHQSVQRVDQRRGELRLQHATLAAVMLDVDHQKRRVHRVAAVRHRFVTVSGITASPSFKWLTPTSPPESAVSRSQQSTNKRTSLLAAAHLRVEAKVSLEKRYTTPC